MSNGDDTAKRLEERLHARYGAGSHQSITEGLEKAYPPVKGDQVFLEMLEIARFMRDVEHKLRSLEKGSDQTRDRCSELEKDFLAFVKTREDRDKVVLVRIIGVLFGLLVAVTGTYMAIIQQAAL